MIYFQGGLTLPELPANVRVPADVVRKVFSAAAVILQRESQIAESSDAYLTGSLLHAGCVALLESVARFQDAATPQDEPRRVRWITSAIAVFGELGMRFSRQRTAFEGYAMALRSLTEFHPHEEIDDRAFNSLYRDTPKPWNLYSDWSHTRRDLEPMRPSGEVRLSRNDIALLNGLYDRPGCTATSRRDWTLAAYPYRLALGGQWSLESLRRATYSVHPAWVMEKDRARGTDYVLTVRGCAIVEQTVPAVLGRGRRYWRYYGMRGFYIGGQR